MVYSELNKFNLEINLRFRLLFVFVLLFSFSTLANSISINSYSFDRPSYSPGEEGVLELSLSLTAQLKQGETLIGFESVGLEIPSEFVKRNSFFIGKASPGIVSLSVPISIPENASSGVYVIPVRAFGYVVFDSVEGVKTEFRSFTSYISLKVVKDPKFSIYIKPELLSSRTNVSFTVCSESGIARELSLQTIGNFLLSSGPLFFGDVEGCKELSSIVEAFEDGKQSMNVVLSYKNEIGEPRSQNFSLPIVVDRSRSNFLVSQLSPLISFEEGNLTLAIKNTGRKVSNLVIKPIDGVTFVGNDRIFISSLGEGEEIVVNQKAFASLEPSTHLVSFSFEWIEEGTTKTEVVEVPLKVISKEGVEVYLEAEPLPLKAGEPLTLSVVVANKASFPLSAVSVSLEGEVELLEISNEKFIGSLQPDDFSSEQFEVIFNSPGKKQLTIIVFYKDPSGEQVESSFVMEVNVKEGENDLSLILILALLALILIFKFRKRIVGKIRNFIGKK